VPGGCQNSGYSVFSEAITKRNHSTSVGSVVSCSCVLYLTLTRGQRLVVPAAQIMR
jgi:ATP-dependent protease ClpP protease subunit